MTHSPCASLRETEWKGMFMNNFHTPPREKKLSRYLGLSYITAGACFLFEPYIGVLDILPDCLGYLFIFLGLYRFADLDDRLGEAMKGARNLAFVGIARVVAMLLVFGFVSPTEQPVFMLLALFTLAVLDCLVLVPMWKNICGGLLYMGSRNNATVMFDRRRARGKMGIRNMVERYTATSVVFFVLHELLAVLPELTVLSHEKGGAELGQGTRYYDFVGLFRVVGIGISLILGIIWLVMTIRFIRRLKGDKPFFETLTQKYRAEVLPRHELFAMRAVRISLICLIAAAALSLDFYLDGINMVPDTLTAVLMLLSVIFLRRYAGKNHPAMIATCGYGIITAVIWFLQLNYFGMNDMADALRLEDVNARWKVMVLLQTIAASLLILSMAMIIRSLFALVKRYTGVRTFHENSNYAADRSEAIHTLIRKKLILVMVFTGLVGLSAMFQWGVVPQLAEQDIVLLLGISGSQTNNAFYTFIITGYQVLTEGYWFIDLCFGAALIGVTVSATGEISEQMEYSSMMMD